MHLVDRKICCVGFQKTGASTVGRALKRLGYAVGSSGRRLRLEVADASDPSARMQALAKEVLTNNDAIQDIACPFLYADFDAWYPGSKFVLTVLLEDKWLEGMKADLVPEVGPLRQFLYGAAEITSNEASYCERYRTQNEAIRRYFAARPNDFLELDAARSDAWYRLFTFLGRSFLPPLPRAAADDAEPTEKQRRRAKRAVRLAQRRTAGVPA